MVVLSVIALAAVGVSLWRPWETSGTTKVDAGTPFVAAVVVDAGPAQDEDAGLALVRADVDAGSEDDADAGAVVEASTADGGRAVVLAKRKGKLNVIAMHAGEPYWAQVSVDGVPRGRTPLLLDLPAGRYQLRVERPGFRVEERRVLVAAGKPVVVKITLSP